VYQRTAIDVFTGWATVAIVLGPVNATHTVRFLPQVLRHYRRLGVGVRAVLTDNGPEHVAAGFLARLATKNLAHVRIPPRSPNHNSVCKRLHGTILQDGCVRPSIAGTSPRSASSGPRQMPGSSATTTDGRTTGVHAGQDSESRPRQLQAEQGSTTITPMNQSAHLSPRPSVRKL
jgi:transposase InsO family protein